MQDGSRSLPVSATCRKLPAWNLIIIIIILMTREAGVAYKSIKYELCILKAEYTNLANEFTTTVFFDVNK